MQTVKIEDKLKKEYNKIDESIVNLTSLLKVIIYEQFGEKVEIMYSIIDDNNKFAQMLDAFGGMNVNFPTVEQFKSLVTLSMVFYYKEVMHLSWDKIEQLIPNERDISLRYGAKMKSLSNGIKKQLRKIGKINNLKVKREELFI